MPVVNVNLALDDKTYAGVMTGALELCGMVKDQNHRIRKHLPTVVDSAKEGASKAIDIVRGHKTAAITVGGLLIVGGVVVGTVSYFSHREKRKADKQFCKALQKYIDYAKAGNLTVEVLDSLMNCIDTLSKYNKDGQIPLNISTKQLTDLFNSVYDFTKRMAEANDFDIHNIKAPSRVSKNKVIDLQNYLIIQRKILLNTA